MQIFLSFYLCNAFCSMACLQWKKLPIFTTVHKKTDFLNSNLILLSKSELKRLAYFLEYSLFKSWHCDCQTFCEILFRFPYYYFVIWKISNVPNAWLYWKARLYRLHIWQSSSSSFISSLIERLRYKTHFSTEKIKSDNKVEHGKYESKTLCSRMHFIHFRAEWWNGATSS